jgi:hypothetical protein
MGQLQEKTETFKSQLKEKEHIVNCKIEENAHLKNIIDEQKETNRKNIQKLERAQDQLSNKELDLRQVEEDFDEYKKKHQTGAR